MLIKILKFLQKVDHHEIFTEQEAWVLFKVSAIAEAFGWTLLIYGIAAKRLHLFASSFALPIGGSIHGMLFIAYLLIVISAYSSLGWPRWKALLGVMMSVIPLGTWVFEMNEAHTRRKRSAAPSQKSIWN
jgi:integral membrane protein